jgi:hypothetical protein
MHAHFGRKSGPPGQLEDEALLGVREAAELHHTPDKQELRPWTTDRDVQGAWNLVWVACTWLDGLPRPYHLSYARQHQQWQSTGLM